MDTSCDKCRFAELIIPGKLLNVGEYGCSLGCDTACRQCEKFEYDLLNEGFEYSYAS